MAPAGYRNPMNEMHDPDEVEQDEVDDKFRALMEGLRTTLPGVSVLFGFLLVLPLQASFANLEASLLWAYYIAFFSAALASVLLIAPSIHQRIRAVKSGVHRRYLRHVIVAVRLTIVGSISFLISMVASVYLVTELVLRTSWALVALGITLVVGLWAWLYLPLVNFAQDAEEA